MYKNLEVVDGRIAFYPRVPQSQDRVPYARLIPREHVKGTVAIRDFLPLHALHMRVHTESAGARLDSPRRLREMLWGWQERPLWLYLLQPRTMRQEPSSAP